MGGVVRKLLAQIEIAYRLLIKRCHTEGHFVLLD